MHANVLGKWSLHASFLLPGARILSPHADSVSTNGSSKISLHWCTHHLHARVYYASEKQSRNSERGHAFLSKLSVLIRDQHEAQSVHACSTLRKKIRSRKASWILSWCRAHNAALKLAQVPTTVSSSQNSIVPYTMPTVLLFRIPYYLSVNSVCCIVDKNRITINTASAFSANVQVVPVDDIHSA